jgi:hypothetical protein
LKPINILTLIHAKTRILISSNIQDIQQGVVDWANTFEVRDMKIKITKCKVMKIGADEK